MRNWKSILAALAVTAAAVVIPATPAAAYNLNGCKFSTGTLKWQDATSTSAYASAAQNAVTAWNSTSTQFNLNKVTSGANIRVANGNFGATWNGYQFVGVTLDTSQGSGLDCSGGTWDTTMVTWWNDYYTKSYGATKRQAIMVHELGHALGLAHTNGSSCSNVAVMDTDIDYWADACSFWKPRQDDINGANALY
ncbi:matrixin family metalloprotease [Streptomyces sp. NPDC005408]|uniref:matrixin family metalloprotease n=1 Tax=Streptomyces sp. NPDC005408 TaxID=3155341 RepID=UPI0033A583B0